MTIDEQTKQLEQKLADDRESFRQEYYPNIPQDAFIALRDFLFFIGV